MREVNWCGHIIYTKAVENCGQPWAGTEVYASKAEAEDPWAEQIDCCPECGADIEVAW